MGQQFGPYELREELGRGGSAVVYKALDASRQGYVAIKVIAATHALDETFRARFRQEAEVIARLEHPHVLKVLESGEGAFDDPASSDELAYLVTEYMAGGSLSGQLVVERDAAEGAQLALAVAQQIGAALDWAHQTGILHRDVKPSNVLIGADGRLVLGDFGLARVLQSDASLHPTLTGMVAGTPAYMAPEQALGEPADARTDLYGLAVVLYEIVTGRVPFHAETPLATMLAHVHQPVPFPDSRRAETPPTVAAVLVRALAKSPQDRFQSGSELTAALRAAVVAAYGESQIVTGAYPVARSVAENGSHGSLGSGPVSPSRNGAAVRPSNADRPRWQRLGQQVEDPSSRGRQADRPALPGASGPVAAPGRTAARARTWSLPLRLGAGATASLLALGAVTTLGATLGVGPARPALARLVTRLATEATQPRVERILPPNTKNPTPTLRPDFTILFNVKMEQESVERAVRFDPPVPLDFEWYDTDLDIVVVTPRVDLEPGTWYTLIVERTAVDIEGRLLADGSRISYRSIAEAPPGRGSGLAAQMALVLTPAPSAVAPPTGDVMAPEPANGAALDVQPAPAMERLGNEPGTGPQDRSTDRVGSSSSPSLPSRLRRSDTVPSPTARRTLSPLPGPPRPPAAFGAPTAPPGALAEGVVPAEELPSAAVPATNPPDASGAKPSSPPTTAFPATPTVQARHAETSTANATPTPRGSASPSPSAGTTSGGSRGVKGVPAEATPVAQPSPPPAPTGTPARGRTPSPQEGVVARPGAPTATPGWPGARAPLPPGTFEPPRSVLPTATVPRSTTGGTSGSAG